MKVLQETNQALEEQSSALSEQAQMYKEEIIKIKEKSKLNEEQSNQNMNEVYTMCQARKNEAVGQLKDKINELANELSACISKLNIKNKEIEANEVKFSKLETQLEEVQRTVSEEKTKKEQFSLQIESLKYQINNKDREIEALGRDKTIFKEKSSEHESRYDNLKRKFDYLLQEKSQIDR